MGSLSMDAIIAKIREADTVMTEPEMATLARTLEPYFGKSDPNTILQEAEATIRDRMKTYGDPRTNIVQVAEGWTAYLKNRGIGGGPTITVADVCVMMIILKSMRLSEGPHKDSVVDIAGYAELIAILGGEDDL